MLGNNRKNYGAAWCVCCNGNLMSYAHIERMIRRIVVRWCMTGLLWVSHGRARMKYIVMGLICGDEYV
jgi:hypothetical protein